MPLVRIDLVKGLTEPQIAAIGNAIQKAMVETVGVPERDRFQVINEHAPNRFLYNRGYLGVERSDMQVVVQIFFSKGRTTEQKQALYAALAKYISTDAQLRPEDVMVVLSENTREDWSFGNGVAQYVTMPKELWK
jgi:phenylpyruvate tautomerase PptA (4-oxalocrotonate tautomerase family)